MRLTRDQNLASNVGDQLPLPDQRLIPVCGGILRMTAPRTLPNMRNTYTLSSWVRVAMIDKGDVVPIDLCYTWLLGKNDAGRSLFWFP